jgi:outer membrane lipoprotein carrier protein
VLTYRSVELVAALGVTAVLLFAPAVASPASPAASPTASPTPAGDPAAALARRIEQRHHRVSDLTARFVQTYRSGILSQEVVEKGVVSLKRPGRMLWEYREPEKKTFVSDGKAFYFYVPEDRQVIVREQAGQRGIPALLLSGRDDLLLEFDAALEKPPAPGLQRLRLTPKKADPEVERVFLDVDQGDRIRGVWVRDVQGNESRFQFEGIRENVGLPDRLFRFEVPRGVEVISG